MRNEKVTIEDVAAKAGVSVATVSRVMNGIQKVREETRQRVLDAMDELSYAPNASARSLRRRESNAVLVLTPNLTNPFYTHILTGINDCAREMNYSALIVPIESVGNVHYELKELLDSKKADGAILLSTILKDGWLKKFESDYCLVQCAEYSRRQDSRIPHVSIDNYRAMYDMTKYMLSIGHRNMALVINDNNFVSTNQRVKGFRDAMLPMLSKEEIEASIYRGTDYNFDTGVEAVHALMQRKNPPTAILCISDILALGVIRGANEMGYSVPEDLSVTGFDDVDYTKMFHPYLTTIRQPCYELGKKSMEILLDCLAGQSTEREVYMSYEIKVRESTRETG